MVKSISNSDDVIDSRDVIERIKEMEEERADLAEAVEAATEALAEAVSAKDGADNQAPDADYDLAGTVDVKDEALTDAKADLAAWDEDNGDELAALKTLAEGAEGYAPDWEYGATLIRESYFVDHCQELLEDIGTLPKDIPGFLAIDWKATADNLKVEYTEVDFDGVTYLVR